MDVGIACWHNVHRRGMGWDKLMFRGCYIHSVDDKSRICLPAKLRRRVSDRVFLTKGLEGCLWLLTEDQWNLVREKASSSASIQRFFLASGRECSPGPRGRIALPVDLRNHSSIKPGEEIAIVGLGSRIEIWSLARWEAISSQIAPQRIREELPEFFSTEPTQGNQECRVRPSAARKS